MLGFGLIDGGVAGAAPIPPDPLDLFPTGQFNTLADFDSWTDTTGDWAWDSVDLQADKTIASAGNIFSYPVTLIVGAEYTVDAEATFNNNPRYLVNGDINFDVLLGAPLSFIAQYANQDVGVTTDTAIIDMSSISLLKTADPINIKTNPDMVTDIVGWDITNQTVGTNDAVWDSVDGGSMIIDANTDIIGVGQLGLLTAGRTYRVELRVGYFAEGTLEISGGTIEGGVPVAIGPSATNLAYHFVASSDIFRIDTVGITNFTVINYCRVIDLGIVA